MLTIKLSCLKMCSICFICFSRHSFQKFFVTLSNTTTRTFGLFFILLHKVSRSHALHISLHQPSPHPDFSECTHWIVHVRGSTTTFSSLYLSDNTLKFVFLFLLHWISGNLPWITWCQTFSMSSKARNISLSSLKHFSWINFDERIGKQFSSFSKSKLNVDKQAMSHFNSSQ